MAGGSWRNQQPYPSAADRNKDPILGVLRSLVPTSPISALELATGYGTHVGHFARHLPQVTWQPTDLNSSNIESVHTNSEGLKNILPFMELDATSPPKSLMQGGPAFNLVLCINMIHISPWAATLGLFAIAGRVLRPGGVLVTYGPYAQDGVLAPESNQQFDRTLRSRDAAWGIRDIVELREVALSQGLVLHQTLEMPANNKTLVFVKKKEGKI